jgi:peptidoglycan/LPS O-acetylase OafA/YrhL
MKPLVWMGKVSFSAYLIHVIVILTVRGLLPDLEKWLALAVILLAISVCSLIGYFMIERPIYNLAHQQAKRNL